MLLIVYDSLQRQCIDSAHEIIVKNCTIEIGQKQAELRGKLKLREMGREAKGGGIRHIYSTRNHPQTNGKIERLNRTAKEPLNLVAYTSPSELQEALDKFRTWHNHEHYHKSIGNLHPADVYSGHGEAILNRRKKLQPKQKRLADRSIPKLNQNH